MDVLWKGHSLIAVCKRGWGGGQEVIEAVAVIRVRKEECFKEVWECGGRPGMKDVK